MMPLAPLPTALSHLRLSVLHGPMSSSKTARLIALHRAVAAAGVHARTCVVASAVDTRPGVRRALVSRTGDALAFDVRTPSLAAVEVAPCTLYTLDEAHFYAAPELLAFAAACAAAPGATLLVAGLDYDFKREPFGGTLALARAARALGPGEGAAVALRARCCHRSAEDARRGAPPCGAPAEFSQRLVAGGTELVLVGGADFYRAACVQHHACEPIDGRWWADAA